MIIKNRREFVFWIYCSNGNPNGDPDADNCPRMDDETNIGLMSDASIKRRVRNYIEMAFAGKPGMDILVRSGTNLNRAIAQTKEEAGLPVQADDEDSIKTTRERACEKFFDVRSFGAVMSTGPKGGQVRGPVQFAFGRSLDEISPVNLTITRVCSAEDLKGKKGTVTAADYEALEESTPLDKRRTMGRKYIIPFGLYEVHGFISANLAEDTGFSEDDLHILFNAIMNMYEHDHSATRGEMGVVTPMVVFKHVGLDNPETNPIDNANSAKLGCAPAHKLFELVSVKKKDDVEYPRSYRDYDAHVALDRVPRGVEVGFYDGNKMTWGKLPEDETWFK